MLEQSSVNIWSLSDLSTPWCVHVAATLRIADHIEAGKSKIHDLAAAADCEVYALHRVLTHLTGKGLFEETSPGRFALNDAARQLMNPMARLSLDLDGLGGRMAHAWGTLLTYVRTGEPGYQQVFGLPFWDDLDAHPDIAAKFDAFIGPEGHGLPKGEFEISGGWETVQTIVDVGGGTGAMLGRVLRLHPHLHGMLVDQPRTVALSGEIFQATGVADRVTTVGQSFFDPLPTGADLYVLRGILNDFPDREATAILRRCAEAARPNGRVVVLGGVTDDDAPRGVSIEMVLLGGKQRSISELRAIAREAGLEVTAAAQQAAYFVCELKAVSG
jgi:2,7-dihydroxy-5-methyl-1-naphthoate 7-O-methyltransferase